MERRKLDLERAKMEARFINTLAYRMDQENGHPKLDYFQLDSGPIQTETAQKVSQLMISIDEAAEETHKIESSIERKRDDYDAPQFLKVSDITRKKWCRADYNDVRTARAELEAEKAKEEQMQAPTALPWPVPDQQPNLATYMASASSATSQEGAGSKAWAKVGLRGATSQN